MTHNLQAYDRPESATYGVLCFPFLCHIICLKVGAHVNILERKGEHLSRNHNIIENCCRYLRLEVLEHITGFQIVLLVKRPGMRNYRQQQHGHLHHFNSTCYTSHC